MATRGPLIVPKETDFFTPNVGWGPRTENSTRLRETYEPFVQDKEYIANVLVMGSRMDIQVLGSKLAGPGMERQANASFADIQYLPSFYETA